MIILGLSLGELSTAALMIDGVIVAAASEERFTRIKNDERYPRQAIDYCLREAGISSAQIDRVAIAGMTLAFDHWITRTYSTFKMHDQIKAQREFWYPKFYEKKDVAWTQVFQDKLDFDQYPSGLESLIDPVTKRPVADVWPKLRAMLHRAIVEHLDVTPEQILHLDHHACHAAYAYWGSPFRTGRTLVLTADAWGDDVSATVSVAENGEIRRLHTVPHTEFKLARLYRYVTLLLGMKPNEHEYKVMGLAAYAKPEILEGPYRVFADTMFVNGLGFGWRTLPPDMYYYFRERLEGYRFDGIAGGLQKYTEEILVQWVKNALAATQTDRLVFSGGVAMNIKAHKVLHEMPEVADMFVCGSGADESLALGVCYEVMAAHCKATGRSSERIRHHGYYLGPAQTPADVRNWIQARRLNEKYDIETGATSAQIAQHLANGHVIGRCCGRMEFGQRSLGNRSIIADPRNPQMIDKINRQIKNRDFWMPFAPSMLTERAHKYVVNPKQIKSPAMTIGFDSTDEGKRLLGATLHPADRSLRPQLLERAHNPDYYALIEAFEQQTGVASVLNTSFNLHGEPIVCTPDDALHVLESSDIDMIAVEDVLVKKRPGQISA